MAFKCDCLALRSVASRILDQVGKKLNQHVPVAIDRGWIAYFNLENLSGFFNNRPKRLDDLTNESLEIYRCEVRTSCPAFDTRQAEQCLESARDLVNLLQRLVKIVLGNSAIVFRQSKQSSLDLSPQPRERSSQVMSNV